MEQIEFYHFMFLKSKGGTTLFIYHDLSERMTLNGMLICFMYSVIYLFYFTSENIKNP